MKIRLSLPNGFCVNAHLPQDEPYAWSAEGLLREYVKVNYGNRSFIARVEAVEGRVELRPLDTEKARGIANVILKDAEMGHRISIGTVVDEF